MSPSGTFATAGGCPPLLIPRKDSTPDLPTFNDDLMANWLAIQNWANQMSCSQLEAIFSFPGALVVSSSPRWYPRRNTSVLQVFASVDTAPTGQAGCVVTVEKDETVIVTLTIATGQNTKASTTILSPSLTADTDYLEASITTAGGASDLTVQVRCS